MYISLTLQGVKISENRTSMGEGKFSVCPQELGPVLKTPVFQSQAATGSTQNLELSDAGSLDELCWMNCPQSNIKQNHIDAVQY